MNLTGLTILWPPFGDAAPEATPDSLLSAIVAWLARSQAALDAAGGYSTDRARDTSGLPYLTLREAGSQVELRTSSVDAYAVTVEVQVYAADLDQAGSVGDALAEEMAAGGGIALTFLNGSTTPFQAAGEPRHRQAAADAPGAVALWCQERRWTTRVIRRRS